MAEWYYAENDVRHGPVGLSEMERLIDLGGIFAETLVWREGMEEWEAAAIHFPQLGGTKTPPPISAMTRPPAADNGDQIGPDGLYVGAPSREFIEAAKVCFSKYATFSGRASRSEYWFFYLFWNVAMFVAQIVDVVLILGMMALGLPFFFPILTVLGTFGFILPFMAVSWRRLHDIDRTGWWIGGGMIASFLVSAAIIGTAIAQETSDGFQGEPPEALLALVGLFSLGIIVYAVTVFIFTVTKGTLGPNRFG